METERKSVWNSMLNSNDLKDYRMKKKKNLLETLVRRNADNK